LPRDLGKRGRAHSFALKDQPLPRQAFAVKPMPAVAKARGVDQDTHNKKSEDRMAEGMLGGMLGGGEEKPEVEPAEPLAGAEAFAAAVAAKLAGAIRRLRGILQRF
jgi:hypothetical protein